MSPIRRLNELAGKRVAVGPTGSGTQLLAKQLLGANGVSESNATFVRIDESCRLEPIGDPFGPKLLPLSPE
jgi:TRAP-type uncharacterized transport system substrate-binding protein